MEPTENIGWHMIGWLMATATRKMVFRHVWDENRLGSFPTMHTVVENLGYSVVDVPDVTYGAGHGLVEVVVKEMLEKGWLLNRGRKNHFKLYANLELAGVISDWQEERGKKRFDQGKFFRLEGR